MSGEGKKIEVTALSVYQSVVKVDHVEKVEQQKMKLSRDVANISKKAMGARI